MTKSQVFCVKIKNIDYVFLSVFIDMLIFGLSGWWIGELIKFSIERDLRLNIIFIILALCFFLNFYRAVDIFWRKVLDGLFNKTVVIVRFFVFVLAFLFMLNISNIYEEDGITFGQRFFAVLNLSIAMLFYVYFTIIYKNIIWQSKEPQKKEGSSYAVNDWQIETNTNKQNIPAPKTWGKIRVHEYEKIEEGNSFLRHYEKTIGKEKKNQQYRQKKTLGSTLTKKDAHFFDKNTTVRETWNHDRREINSDQLSSYKKEDHQKEKNCEKISRPPQVEEKKSTQCYGKIRVLENQGPFEESDSWIRRYEREVLKKGKRKSFVKKPIPEEAQPQKDEPIRIDQLQDKSNIQVIVEQDYKMNDLTEPLYQNKNDNHTEKKKPHEKKSLATTYGKIRVLEQQELVKEDDSFIKRYERAMKMRKIERTREIEHKQNQKTGIISAELETPGFKVQPNEDKKRTTMPEYALKNPKIPQRK